MDEKEMIQECRAEMEKIIKNINGGVKENHEIYLKYADSPIGKIRRNAGETIGKKGKKEINKIYEFLLEYIKYDSVNVRWTTSVALGELGVTDFRLVIQILRELADDEDWSVREAVASALISINKKCPDAIPELTEWAKDSRENVRRAVAESLGRGIGQSNPEVTIPILELLLEDDSLYVRKAVANSCRNISRNSSDFMLNQLEKWIKMTESEFGKWTLADGSREIAKQKPEIILPLLQKLANDDRKYVQGCVVSVIKEIQKANAAMIEMTMQEWKNINNDNVKKVAAAFLS